MAAEVILLGVAQDAGLPQAGCACANCHAVRSGAVPRQQPVCLALVDHEQHASWLVDATPAFPEQVDLLGSLAPGCALRGIVLTHAHMGHYTGLVHLGREAMNTHLLPVYASERLAGFLRANGPWSQLFENGNIALCEIRAGEPFALSQELTLEPRSVPHRAEYSDTLAFVVHGPSRRLFYCPDIDGWEAWEEPLAPFLAGMDYALLDGTFHSADELPGRDMREIAHPPVEETLTRLGASASASTCAVRFIHLNHSNPLYRDGPERRALEAAGFGVGATGMRFALDGTGARRRDAR